MLVSLGIIKAKVFHIFGTSSAVAVHILHQDAVPHFPLKWLTLDFSHFSCCRMLPHINGNISYFIMSCALFLKQAHIYYVYYKGGAIGMLFSAKLE